MNKYHLHNRPNREIFDNQQINDILKNGKYAVLSLCKDNEPYIVTLSYGYDEKTNSLFFHCAKEGMKMDFISVNPLVCGTIIEDGGYIKNECGHWYKTLIFRGKMEIVSDLEEKMKGMKIILNHLEDNTQIIEKKLNASHVIYNTMVVLKLAITDLHAKAGR